MHLIFTQSKVSSSSLKIFSLLALAILTGCAAPAGIEQMSVNAPVLQSIDSPLKKSVRVTAVTGGRETNPMWSSQVSSESFQRALELSLQNVGLTNPLIAANKYHLTADILQVSQPMLGLDMTVSANVRYSLIESATRKELFSKVIVGVYTAKFSDAFAGAERLKLANEGAAKRNIQLLVDDLFKFTPPQ
jgi:hypothetical protein